MNKKQIDKLRLEAYQRGLDDGYNDGEIKGRKDGIKTVIIAIIEMINDE